MIKNAFLKVCCGLLMVGAWTPGCLGQGEIVQSRCLDLLVRLNGKQVASPKTVQVADTKLFVDSQESCFSVPGNLLALENVSLSFVVGRNKVTIEGLGTADFIAPIEILLADHHFGIDYDWAINNKSAIGRTCILIYHHGDPERMKIQIPCRTKVALSNQEILNVRPPVQ